MQAYFDKVFQAESGLEQLAQLPGLNSNELDRLPFGAIRLDRHGNIVHYNATEAKLSGYKPASLVGKNFFTDVAPCTNVREFGGRFREGVAKKWLHAVFPYSFNFSPPVTLTVTLYYHPDTDSAWVLIRTAE
jgi:photoactive yellow protein